MILKLKNINKSYGGGSKRIDVLKNINLDINKGDFIIISGRSGAGKSTLLYQMGILDEPSSGDIYLLNQRINDWGYIKKTQFRLENLGYVFQDYALIPELTANENVVLPLLMLGYNKKMAFIKTKENLIRFSLGDKINNLPSQLSGGEQQRVAIARAVINNPKIIFADEPTANLDSINAERIMRVFKSISSHNQTIVMVSHEEKYYSFANRIIYLDDGIIVRETKNN